MAEPLDVERELEALRNRVRGMNIPPSVQLTPLQKAISSVNANWHLSARLAAPPNAPWAWRAVYLSKRVVRSVMAELLKSLVEQQNSFNAQAARALTELAKENAELRTRIEELEKKMNQ